MIRELGTSGVPIDAFLRRYGLSAAQLAGSYERIPLRHFVALAENAAQRLERPFLGLELGANFALADLGPFYAMFILAQDLQTALTRLSRFQAAWQTNTLLEFVRGNPTSACRYGIQDPSIWPRRQDAEFAMACFTSFIRELTSKRWRPISVEFEHDVGDREVRLTEFFHAPVHGNCGANQLIIANSDLKRPLRSRFEAGENDIVPTLERHLMDLLRSPEKKLSQTVASRVGALIARRLGSAEVTIDAVAAEMNMSERTLRRHLTEEGTSFRQILQTHRRTAIETVLHSDGARLSDLASRLSYSDSAALSHAFKRWTGMSPRAYVKSQKD
jgi:AraC-like DNA-binding protein